eukprot:TRINITY_DN9974_c0_g1_i1.p1 TRINITY_DN9974_c0_g1~~TRINITY_DN9974_c0_g1_i1.p1  ORF type:complete len:347 (-),score=91.63 TRINITY_DN9974_c0_g1_i1:106-1146(-)
MVIRNGGVASGFEALEEKDELADGSPELFHVKGTNERNTKAVQVASKCSSLCSADCFVLNWEMGHKQYIWMGKGAEFVEKEFAKKVATFLREIVKGENWSVVEFEEGLETDEFFEILGGKTIYLNASDLQSDVSEPRLFHCSDASGSFQIEELQNFTQEDLMMDDIYLLDTVKTVFVWIGPQSNEEEKEGSFKMALEYVKTASKYDGRSLDTPVVCTLAGFEPPMFTYWFQGWDPSLAGTDSLNLVLEQLNVQVDSDNTVLKSVQDVVADLSEKKYGKNSKTYSYAQLRTDQNEKLPSVHVKPGELEFYLHDDDFQILFKMTKEEWKKSKIPKWKRDQIKRSLHLF